MQSLAVAIDIKSNKILKEKFELEKHKLVLAPNQRLQIQNPYNQRIAKLRKNHETYKL